MAAIKNDFAYSTTAEPHRDRTKKILQQHPEIRGLIGKNPMTFWYTLGIVAFQIAVAYLLRDQSWWLIVAAAYLAGAFADHALFVVIHECAHNLVFKRKVPNILVGLLANLPQIIPSSVSFQRYHLKHHAFQGVYELDADLPHRWEAKLVGHSFLGKALWLLFYPIFQGLRPLRLKEIAFMDRWIFLNWAVQFTFDALVWILLGPKAFFYMLLSLFFSVGLHPLGARWIQRHYLVEGGEQETYSYYGSLNKLAFNVGYHNEHHDFPSVPWNNLPKVKQSVPEIYDKLSSHGSWAKLLLRFLADSKLSLYSRIVRSERGKVRFDEDVTPDADLIKAEGSKIVEREAVHV